MRRCKGPKVKKDIGGNGFKELKKYILICVFMLFYKK